MIGVFAKMSRLQRLKITTNLLNRLLISKKFSPAALHNHCKSLICKCICQNFLVCSASKSFINPFRVKLLRPSCKQNVLACSAKYVFLLISCCKRSILCINKVFAVKSSAAGEKFFTIYALYRRDLCSDEG